MFSSKLLLVSEHFLAGASKPHYDWSSHHQALTTLLLLNKKAPEETKDYDTVSLYVCWYLLHFWWPHASVTILALVPPTHIDPHEGHDRGGACLSIQGQLRLQLQASISHLVWAPPCLWVSAVNSAEDPSHHATSLAEEQKNCQATQSRNLLMKNK